MMKYLFAISEMKHTISDYYFDFSKCYQKKNGNDNDINQKMSNFVNQKNEINMFCIDAKNCQISDYFERHDLSVIFSRMLAGTPFNLAASTSFFNSSTSRFNLARLFWNLG
ncbi:hypothetical protein DERP_013033 [Dermatophagoides pteronyssinus]|uniref:Uncharacterized protein n=1 Tax=Dermatophagoides pteronyssinus TaxID=6956 RepID=A0ABQ8JPT5_DERPT|nr:hypothetical protein DERP_013033 [Dermatophagoides pteronyssinus]